MPALASIGGNPHGGAKRHLSLTSPVLRGGQSLSQEWESEYQSCWGPQVLQYLHLAIVRRLKPGNCSCCNASIRLKARVKCSMPRGCNVCHETQHLGSDRIGARRSALHTAKGREAISLLRSPVYTSREISRDCSTGAVRYHCYKVYQNHESPSQDPVPDLLLVLPMIIVRGSSEEMVETCLCNGDCLAGLLPECPNIRCSLLASVKANPQIMGFHWHISGESPAGS